MKNNRDYNTSSHFMLILGFLPPQRITMFTAHYKKRGCIVKLDYETASSCGRRESNPRRKLGRLLLYH